MHKNAYASALVLFDYIFRDNTSITICARRVSDHVAAVRAKVSKIACAVREISALASNIDRIHTAPDEVTLSHAFPDAVI